MSTLKNVVLRVAALACLFAGPAFSTDHADSPATGADPAADLLDLYAFVIPLCESENGTACENDPGFDDMGNPLQ